MPAVTGPDPEIVPPWARVACFFWTAPIAVITAGVALLVLAEQPLLNNWSPVTMGLTHVITLGFLTMTLFGSFYLLVPLRLGRRIKAPRLVYVVYGTFTIGSVFMSIGLAGVAVTPVFIAVGGLFPALGCFFWPAIGSLRGTRELSAATPLRLAVGAFLAVAFIGIWVAHGHGGMKFPGPRGVWIEVKLAIALLGWIGAMSTAAFDFFSRDESSKPDDTLPIMSIWWGRLLWIGIVAPIVLLGLQYLTLIEISLETATWTATACIAPAVIATWLIQPVYGLRRLKDPTHRIAEPHYWQTAFALAPVALGLGVTALILPQPVWRIAFGWVALWGWAGLLVHAILREFTGHRRSGTKPEPSEDGPRDLAYPLHLLSLGLGVAAIATGNPALARVTGAVLLALGIVQIHRLVRQKR